MNIFELARKNLVLTLMTSETNTPAIFFLFHFVNTSHMERIKKATLLGDLLFSERKERNLLKPLAAWVLTLYSWNIPLFAE
jgi:hypothetical protein